MKSEARRLILATHLASGAEDGAATACSVGVPADEFVDITHFQTIGVIRDMRG